MPTLSRPTPRTRWQIPGVLAITIFVNYLDRNNLALAIPRIAQDFGWSDREIGSKGELLLAAFFLSYAVSNMLLSPLAERFGPKRSVMGAIAAFSLVTLLSGPLGYSFGALVLLRLLLGLGEGVHIPMSSAITSRWFMPEERSRANAIWGSGILVSTAIAPLLVVPLIQFWGWRSTFTVLGFGGMLLSIPLVYFLIPNDVAEETDSSETITTLEPKVTASPRYRRDFRFWLTVAGGSLNAFCAFGLLNWLPTYFNRARGIDFEQLGWPLALVFAAGIMGMALMAYLGDLLQRRTQVAGVGFLMAGAMVYLASTTTQIGLVVLCFAIAVFCQSAYGAQEYAIVQHLLPVERVGAGTGFYNGLSVLLGGVGGSLIPGSIVAVTGSFDAGILSIVVGAWLAAAIMLVLSRMLRY
ncbi:MULTISPECIES: MFS transporter [unclassified Leptolyngbya]|uniref:MFS transporter n=1 Tax=unclassified Leptolyngbya TaxID=2650499 RepID=UPI0016851C73|nr:MULTISPECIES: MFS transporter [unclassified Leptolyngbya]MBD1912605.1 MFS transporter [Leptolyngbya sp. FACHB-8]MBD2156774.1 MFS transporter [Leptolyngbya sp. FACHB-16]